MLLILSHFMKHSFSRLIFGAICFFPLFANAQTGGSSSTVVNATGQKLNAVSSAVPFLNFTPDARSGAMGDAGVALSPDANSIYWNPSKLVFAEKNAGGSLSYTPWLRDLIGDMYYTYLTGYKKVGKNQALGFSMNYFDLGTIQFTTSQGLAAGTFNSREYAFTGSYSARLTKNFSMGVNLKYLNSNLAGSTQVAGTPVKPAATAAADISAYYRNETRDESTGRGLGWAFGGMISNLGGQVSYGTTQRYYIPTNLRLGTAITYYADQFNKFNFALDLNKLMVPTPPVNTQKSYLANVFGSFGDAPGGASEELQEVNISTGVEYWYNDQFAARMGYFNEADTKGGRKFFTAGVGIRLQDRYGIDFSYLLPVKQGSPLANTFRISLLIDLTKGVRIADDEEEEETTEESNN
jgi:hypothetical protein